jgi:hypothetical protein
MRQTGLTHYDPKRACHGYTLFSPMEGTATYLIDMRGNVVHRWQLEYRPGDYGYLLENGNLLVSGRTNQGPVSFGGRGGVIMELDWEGNKVWEYIENTLHHDFCRMDNGNTMVLGWEAVPPEISRQVKGGIPETNSERILLSDYFREITPGGQTVWEWHHYQHLDPEQDAICPIHHRDEWTHTNTCKVLPNGNIMTSFRILDTVAIIDKASGDFVWKWGRGELGHQHDPNLLDNGNVLIFDNGWHTVTAPSPGSRVVEVNPNTNRIKWEYKTRPPWLFFSSFISGAQRQPNGNTLICEGMTGRLFEVTRDGETVWEYNNPFYGEDERFGHVNRVFRTYRYGPDFPGFRDKELDARKYDWLNRLYQ